MPESKAPRPQEQHLVNLEAHYRNLLLSVLGRCADGKWGLFGQNDNALGEASRKSSLVTDPTTQELLTLGPYIEHIRRKLGFEPYPLHERLLRMCSSPDANTLGEPQVALAWLKELEPGEVPKKTHVPLKDCVAD